MKISRLCSLLSFCRDLSLESLSLSYVPNKRLLLKASNIPGRRRNHCGIEEKVVAQTVNTAWVAELIVPSWFLCCPGFLSSNPAHCTSPLPPGKYGRWGREKNL